MNGILSQYMMRTILASTALVLVVLLALAGLFEFIAELDDTPAGDTDVGRVRRGAGAVNDGASADQQVQGHGGLLLVAVTLGAGAPHMLVARASRARDFHLHREPGAPRPDASRMRLPVPAR